MKHLKTKPSANAGGWKDSVWVAPISGIDVEGLPVKVSELIEGTDYTIEADATARDTTYPSPSGGERVYVQDPGVFQEYNATASAWIRISDVLINDVHTFKVGFGFTELRVTKDKSTSESEYSTEADSTGKIHKTRFGRPGWTVDNLELEKLFAQDGWIVIRYDREGNLIQYGTLSDPCDIKIVEQNVGASAIEWKGIIYEAVYEGTNIFHYNSAITLI